MDTWKFYEITHRRHVMRHRGEQRPQANYLRCVGPKQLGAAHYAISDKNCGIEIHDLPAAQMVVRTQWVD